MAKKEKKQNGGRAPMRRLLIVSVAVITAVLLLVSSLLVTLASRAPKVYRYGSETIRENAYAYWVACYKYELLTSYKHLGITDSTDGWSEEYADGKSYDEVFKESIDREIMLRLIAADVFDSYRANMTTEDYEAITAALADMEEYSYGEDAYALLKEEYGVRKRDLKRIALYEQKYNALRTYLYGEDGSGVYTDPFSAQLAEFYEENYKRYNIICVIGDGIAAEESREVIEAALRAGITEADFTKLEAEHSDLTITSGSYPNGLYLTPSDAGGDTMLSYLGTLLGTDVMEALFAIDAEGKTATVTKEVDGKTATYYLMRYTLDDDAYRNEKNEKAFEGFAVLASKALYRNQLLEELSAVKDYGVAATHTLGTTKTCRERSILWFLARS